ncbi:MAG: hypothetical protein ACK5V3_06740 [Bdellovibrionales bacterium]
MNQLSKIIENLSQNPNVKKFIADVERLGTDLKKMQAELNKKFSTEKEQAIKKAKAEYDRVLAKVKTAEKDLNKEVNQAIVKIKKSASQVEKNLKTYKKTATVQKAKAEKILKAKKKTTTKKAKKKVTRKS